MSTNPPPGQRPVPRYQRDQSQPQTPPPGTPVPQGPPPPARPQGPPPGARPQGPPPRQNPQPGPRPPQPVRAPQLDEPPTQPIPRVRATPPPPQPPRRPARLIEDDQPTRHIPRVVDEETTEVEKPPEDVIAAAAAAAAAAVADEEREELPAKPPEEQPKETGRVVVRSIGEVLITAGLVVLLFVFYEVYVTDWLSAGKQSDATVALDDRWKGQEDPQRKTQFQVGDGEGFAKIRIPKFGADYVYTVLEGTTDKILEVGPGHYKGTAFPGQTGNFAVAGHRVGKGAPFNDIDLLDACDAIVVETSDSWFVYRMMPKSNEVKDWDKTKAANQKCQRVGTLRTNAADGGAYGKTVGQEIVLPSQSGVIAPVPNRPDAQLPSGQQASLITLTTCHPRFSARQRLIVHGVLTHQYKKDPAKPGELPPEMQES
ncbi:class E sortase [Allokutzneria multivorans]|uniref:Class E sortase n=1 Tax=Allokutzneria multivorans TaxID=1142134 RepID=A0ABP7RGG3_9PSEU